MILSMASWIATAGYITATAALSAPLCQSVAPNQTVLNVQTANVSVPEYPFGVIYARPDVAFVSVVGNVTVLNTTTFTPTVIRHIPMPTPFYQKIDSVNGFAISHDKKTVYVAVGTGAVAIDVEKAISGEDAIAGTMGGNTGATAIETTVSHDDEYVFVSIEDGNNVTELLGTIESFHVKRASNGSISSTYVGYIALGHEVVGSALSHDGSKLFVTSESAATGGSGTLSVLDVATLKTNPSQALLVTVDAGCGPVRVRPSPDGKHVWVNARESNMLLAFDTGKLYRNSSDSLVASVQVGTSPVSFVFVNHGRHIVTADSNRFGYSNATSGLTVVDVNAALNGKQGFPRIPTGIFPREVSLNPNGKTLLVTDYGSNVVEAVNVTQLSSL
ncbi:putative isomerase YbhE [Mollisia scopiformis]|uniref:Putative isomerase YbhE n=1 Tax=Mollisia scopiformis TaxID=149040 RepID=A0A194XKZ3_MOLSC|nr:putative isomerase YbhE [Mollisia scopiformis]KUJ20801.1 putative isomerase YbhE [Mollisia scopiformis]